MITFVRPVYLYTFCGVSSAFVWWHRMHSGLSNICWIHHFETTDPSASVLCKGPLVRYVKLWVAHAPGMPGTFSPPMRVSDPDMHHSTCVTHVPWCMPGSLTCGFLWSRRRGKRSQHSRRMRIPQFYVSGKRPIEKRNRITEMLPTKHDQTLELNKFISDKRKLVLM